MGLKHSVVRNSIHAPTPLIALGQSCPASPLPSAEEEVRKMLAAELLTGRPVVLLDNASEGSTIASSSLARVLTSRHPTDRLLGRSEMLALSNDVLWLLTGNNPRFSGELARRCVRIRIDPKMDRPWERRGFRHPNLVRWVSNSRGRLIHAALTLVQAWIAAGSPESDHTLGSFDAWAKTMGGILEVAGLWGFLGGLDELYEAADAEGAEWRAFVAAWWERHGDRAIEVGALLNLAVERELLTSVIGDGTLRSQSTRLGKGLRCQRDRHYGPYAIRFVRSSRYTEWRLEDAGTKTESAGQTTLDFPGDLPPKPADVADLGFHESQTSAGRSPASNAARADVSDVADVVQSPRVYAHTRTRAHESDPELGLQRLQSLQEGFPKRDSGSRPTTEPSEPRPQGLQDTDFDLAHLPEYWEDDQ